MNLDSDHLVSSFVLAWVVLTALVIALDWLGNPNRGGFRPRGERPPRDRRLRREERRRRRLEEDAAVRATLRDRYGTSSLRLAWSGDKERRAEELDDSLVVPHDPTVVEAASREVPTLDPTAVFGEALPNIEERPHPASESAAATAVTTAAGVEHHDEPTPVGDRQPVNGDAAAPAVAPRIDPSDRAATGVTDDDADRDPLPAPPGAPDEPAVGDDATAVADAGPARGWRVGDDPLAPTSHGRPPSATTVRSRVWKNHGRTGAWSEENLERLRAGRAPRRTNPVTGREERGTVDVASGRARWGDDPVDPFGGRP